MDIKDQISTIRKAKAFHKTYYLSQYPDVAQLDIEPIEHYLHYGVHLGRNPRKGFNTSFYTSQYPDVAESGLNPLIHYITVGEQEGRRAAPIQPGSLQSAMKKIRLLRRKMQTLGFEEQPLRDLREDMETNSNLILRDCAALELAIYSFRQNSVEGYEEALSLLSRVDELRYDLTNGSRAHVIEIMCYYHLKRPDDAFKLYADIQKKGLVTPDVQFAMVNFLPDETDRCRLLNEVLAGYGISAIDFRAPKYPNEPLYDRLNSSQVPVREQRPDDPLLTVLVAAYNAEHTLPITLEAIQAQTWKNIEVLVLDDCSTDRTQEVARRYAADDGRIRLISLEKNGGAYAARNVGLAQAKGEFVTIHDADDWSHPEKFATQVNLLRGNQDLMGCMTEQSRATSDLLFTKVSGSGVFLIPNTSSFMFRREPVFRYLGGWDLVRFSADNELIRRVRKFFGSSCVVQLKSGPLSFQRHSETSIVAHEYFGIEGLPSGLRQEYFEAQHYYHENNFPLNYRSGRKFASPHLMWSDRDDHNERMSHFDVIIVSDFRMEGGSTLSNREELRVHKKHGIKTAIVQMYRYDVDARPERIMSPEIRAEVDGVLVHVLTYGQVASCDLLVVRYPPVLQHVQKFVPQITAKKINVIVNQPPMSDYSEEGVMRYELKTCEENLYRYFNTHSTWYPIGPLVRGAMTERHPEELEFIEMADDDWLNIIDIDEWYSGERMPGLGRNLRVGRHSRDNYVKWPSTRASLLAAYPDAEDVDVYVLGGSSTPEKLIGYLPKNWTVHEFNSISPSVFLASIDIFIYFTHDDWVESFGRCILEAMAAGVPAIISGQYRELFGDAAIYATPETAIKFAKDLFADPVAYRAQSLRALDFVDKNFGHAMHIRRLRNAGVNMAAMDEQ